MKTTLLLVVGILLGVAASWVILPRPKKGKSVPEASEHAPSEEAKSEAGLVRLNDKQRVAAGVELGEPKPVSVPAQVKAYGRILDPAPLVALALDLQTAEAAVRASKAEYNRVKILFSQNQNASARTLELAEAALKRDEILLNVAKAKLQTTLGPSLSGAENLGEIINSISRLEWSIARLDLPAMASAVKTTSVQIASIADETHRVNAEILGPATMTESQFQGRGFLLLVRTNSFVPNSAIIGFLELSGEQNSGWLLPKSAVLQDAADMIVFLSTGKNSFRKHAIGTDRLLTNGWLVTNGIGATDRVVVAGAQVLLSELNKGPAEE